MTHRTDRNRMTTISAYTALLATLLLSCNNQGAQKDAPAVHVIDGLHGVPMLDPRWPPTFWSADQDSSSSAAKTQGLSKGRAEFELQLQQLERLPPEIRRSVYGPLAVEHGKAVVETWSNLEDAFRMVCPEDHRSSGCSVLEGSIVTHWRALATFDATRAFLLVDLVEQGTAVEIPIAKPHLERED